MVTFVPKSDDGGSGEQLAPVTYIGAAATHSAPAAQSKANAHPATGSRLDGNDEPGGGRNPSSRASNVAVHQLARRGMSRWELGQVMERRGVEEAVAEAELNRLESVGLLDDAALAVTLVFTQHTRKGLGKTAIARELTRRHIDPEIIADALAEIADDDELERAVELAAKRVGQLRSVDDATAERRLYGFLSRKGYGSSVVREAVGSAMKLRSGSGVRFS